MLGEIEGDREGDTLGLPNALGDRDGDGAGRKVKVLVQ